MFGKSVANRLSAAIIGFNGILHAVWGVEYFLYSQHWHISFMIPLAGLFFYSPKTRPYWTAVVIAIVGLVIAKNWIAMDAIWSYLGN